MLRKPWVTLTLVDQISIVAKSTPRSECLGLLSPYTVVQVSRQGLLTIKKKNTKFHEMSELLVSCVLHKYDCVLMILRWKTYHASFG